MSTITMKDLLKKAGLSIGEMAPGKPYDVADKGLRLKAFDLAENKAKYQTIRYLVYKGQAPIWECQTDTGDVLLRGREDHRVYDPMRKDWVFLGKVTEGHLLTEAGQTVHFSSVLSSRTEPIVDMQIDGENYFSNGVLSHNTVFHSFLGQQIEDPEATKNFIRKVFENSKIPYLTISPVYSICPIHGYLTGKQERCPKCREEQIKAYKKKLNELKKRKADIEAIG